MSGVVRFVLCLAAALLLTPANAGAAEGQPDRNHTICMNLPPVEIAFPGAPLFRIAWRGADPDETRLAGLLDACAQALDARPNDGELLRRLGALTAPIDADTGLFLIEQAADEGDQPARTIRGVVQILSGNEKAGRKLIRAAAGKGHGEAQWLMGYIEQGILKRPNGQGAPLSLGLFAVGKDKTPQRTAKVALDWYEKAVASGYAKAKGDIGILYFRNPDDFGKTPADAVALMTEGAVAGNLLAQSVLGTGYLAGVPPFKEDTKTATLWLARASDGGLGAAGFLLVNLYLTGQFFGGDAIVPVDVDRAREIACRHPASTDAVYEAYAGKKLVCAAP